MQRILLCILLYVTWVCNLLSHSTQAQLNVPACLVWLAPRGLLHHLHQSYRTFFDLKTFFIDILSKCLVILAKMMTTHGYRKSLVVSHNDVFRFFFLFLWSFASQKCSTDHLSFEKLWLGWKSLCIKVAL